MPHDNGTDKGEDGKDDGKNDDGDKDDGISGENNGAVGNDEGRTAADAG